MKPIHFYLEFLLTIFVSTLSYGQARLNYNGWTLMNNYEFNYNNYSELFVDFAPSTLVRMCANQNEPVVYSGNAANILYNTPLPGQMTLRARRIVPFTTPCTDPGAPLPTATPYFESVQLESKAEPINDSCPWRTGWKHGLFEMRCKLPDILGIFPAFWLFLGTDEIDIFEFERQLSGYTSNGNKLTTNLHDWPDGYPTPEYPQSNPADTGTNLKRDCPNVTTLVDYQTLFQDFHTYSLTWTPVASSNPAQFGHRSRITFYLDGIEIRTDTLYRDFGCNLQVIANLSMVGAFIPSNVNAADMVIDYIRVYQKNDYTNQRSMYDFSTSYQPSTITIPSSYYTPLTGRDIIKKGANENFVYYQSSGAKIIRLGRTAGSWIPVVIQTPSGNSAISGSMAIASDNSVLYRGFDGRLQIMYITSGSSYANGIIDDYWSTSSYKVSSSCNAIAVGPNDVVFYKGQDLKMHIFYWDVAVSDWRHRYPEGTTYVPPANQNINGDIGVQQRFVPFSLSCY